MKKILALYISLMNFYIIVYSQTYTPQQIPCDVITYLNAGTFGNHISSYSCLNIGGDQNNAVIFSGNDNIEIKAGQRITSYSQTHIAPSGNGSVHAYIEKSAIEIVWFDPNSTPGTIEQFDKLELGIRFPDNIEASITNFLNDISTTDKLNPFDVDNVNLQAEMSWKDPSGVWVDQAPGIGFFYQEFIRINCSLYSANLGDWTNQNTPYRFRIRYTPRVQGEWRCRIMANIFGYGIFYTDYFPFNVVATSNPHNTDFVRVGENKRFFKIGNDPFFPVGQNLAFPTCWSASKTDDTWNCMAAGTNPDGETYDAVTMKPKGYLIYQNDMEELANAGANYFRMLIVPWSTDIEFGKLNNYYDRMNCAWEMDRILEKAHTLDLRIHLDMQIQDVFERPAVIRNLFWDWLSNQDICSGGTTTGCYPSNPGGVNWSFSDDGTGYAYRNICDPITFFNISNNPAIKPYKNRLRYMIARYGYSTNIATFELLSEINMIGALNTYDPNNWTTPATFGIHPYQDPNNITFQNTLYLWQKEMLDFMKNDLHANQLLSVSYNQVPASGDNTYCIGNLDIATFNNYEHLNDNNKYQNINSWMNILHSHYNKPIMHSEIGWFPVELDCDNNCNYIRDLWCSTFTGLAGTALPWTNQHNYLIWKHLGRIRQFTEGINFDGDLQSGPWIPKYNEQADLLAEMICLRDPSGKRAIGIVSNRTYNAQTQGCSGLYNTDIIPQDLPPVNFSGSLADIWEALHHVCFVPDMVHTGYTIDWYNIMNGIKISTTTSVNLGWVPLTSWLILNHPTLTANEDCPIILFMAYPTSEGSFFPGKSHSNNQNGNNNFEDPQVLSYKYNNKDDNQNNKTNSNSNDLIIFPNPVIDIITIKFSGNSDFLKLIIYTAEGKKCQEQKVNGNIINFDMKAYASGIYILEVQTDERSFHSKITKQ
jgi:hypothetical protein